MKITICDTCEKRILDLTLYYDNEYEVAFCSKECRDAFFDELERAEDAK